MSEGYIHLEIDCVSGEKLVFHKSDQPGALVDVTLNGVKVSVQPKTLFLALSLFGEEA